MPIPAGQNCGNCRFFLPVAEEPDEDDGEGTCLRFPPTGDDQAIDVSFWCGEWQRAAESK